MACRVSSLSLSSSLLIPISAACSLAQSLQVCILTRYFDKRIDRCLSALGCAPSSRASISPVKPEPVLTFARFDRVSVKKKLFTIGKRRKRCCDKLNEGKAKQWRRSTLSSGILGTAAGRDCESSCIADKLYYYFLLLPESRYSGKPRSRSLVLTSGADNPALARTGSSRML